MLCAASLVGVGLQPATGRNTQGQNVADHDSSLMDRFRWISGIFRYWRRPTTLRALHPALRVGLRRCPSEPGSRQPIEVPFCPKGHLHQLRNNSPSPEVSLKTIVRRRTERSQRPYVLHAKVVNCSYASEHHSLAKHRKFLSCPPRWSEGSSVQPFSISIQRSSRTVHEVRPSSRSDRSR